MREFGPSSLSLAGSLLVAHPGLLDPNFSRSVIFISTHVAAEGSFGLVLNRPLGQTVADLLPERDDLAEVAAIPVLRGGPVAQDQLIFASFQWHPEEQRMECRHHLSLEEALEVARGKRVFLRAFIGYSGWGQGQLEGELAQQGWLVKQPESDLFELQEPAHLWRDLISTFGPSFRLTAEAPDDPSLN